MPYGYGPFVFTSSAGGDIGGGRHYTRLRGPVLLGAVAAENTLAPGGGSAGTLGTPWAVPTIVNISSQKADMLVSVVSSAANPYVTTSSAMNVSTGSPAGLVYITMATGAGNLIAAGSTANAPTGLPGGFNGVALCFDSAANTLAIYNPQASAWTWPHSASSGAGAVITWTASSS